MRTSAGVSKLPEHVREKILNQQAQRDAAEKQATMTAAPSGDQGHARIADTAALVPSARPKITLQGLSALLLKLDDKHLFHILNQVPANKLAHALDRSLNGAGSTDNNFGDSDIALVGNDDNQRRADREATNRQARIIYNNKMSVCDCTILDLSKSGCRIGIESTFGIPESFTLQIGNGSSIRECEVVWRKHSEMGVKFFD